MPFASSFPIMAIIWTMTVDRAALTSLEEMIMNPPTDITISPGRLGEYIVSWSGNCTCEKETYYQLDYKYLNSSDDEFSSSRVQTHQEKIDLEFHRGLVARVKVVHDDEHETSSNRTEKIFVPPRDSFASIDNLSCIFYDTYMNCTWDINKKAPQNAQYFLSYRLANEDNLNNCTNYHKDGRRNVACYGHKYERNLVNEVNICVSESSNKSTLPYCRNMNPGLFYKLYTPINVTININTDEVKWTLPGKNSNSDCYTYQINITNWSDHVQKVENVSSTKYVISRDQEKRYSVQVRGTVNDNCFQSSLWSDWTKPLHIGSDSKDFPLLTIAAVVAVIFVGIVLLLVYICVRCKLLSKVCQPIPDPKEKFKGLFEDFDGDFQKWVNKNPPLMTKTEECIPVIVKEV
ncbi:interleukin-5 receptor subunit alpha-like [Heptranchias perlo]|uniref:interleukin-5 receptor subunit alpha-like n=1 Tax=Heptranchias perlo TaxID=212740 RepID=UPI0035597814